MSGHILVVDDDDMLRRLVELWLSKHGFEVTTARNGKEGLEQFNDQSFDVVISDIDMPTMSGIEFLQGVRNRDLDVPVILMTGKPTVDSASEAVGLHAHLYLKKPVEQTVLLSHIQKAVQVAKFARIRRDALALLRKQSKADLDRVSLGASLDRALNCLSLHFQPIVSLKTESIIGYEALMRSKEPLLPHPGAILEAAERLDRLPDVGQKVRSLAVEAFEKHASLKHLFVNLHPVDLLDDTLFQPTSPLAAFSKRITLEITERAQLDTISEIKQKFSTLRKMGYRLALDDIGAGYSGLNSFAVLEPEVTKVDMELIRGIDRDHTKQKLVKALADMCQGLNLDLIAEGIETIEEHQTIKSLGVELAQGYFYGKPQAEPQPLSQETVSMI